MASKAMQEQFEAELDEAPYLAKLHTILSPFHGFPSGASQILDFLYLGAEEESKNLNLLHSLNITHVINCAAGYTMTSQEFYGPIKYLAFNAEDDDSYNMMQHFDEAYRFIEDARISGGKVFVHCLMGINRSGVITVAYCMVHKKMGPISAARFVKKTRRLILSNSGFQRQIVAFARERGFLHLDRGEL